MLNIKSTKKAILAELEKLGIKGSSKENKQALLDKMKDHLRDEHSEKLEETLAAPVEEVVVEEVKEVKAYCGVNPFTGEKVYK